jgi:hypothetical protein
MFQSLIESSSQSSLHRFVHRSSQSSAHRFFHRSLQSSVESSRQSSSESSTQSSFQSSFHSFFESLLESCPGGDPYPWFSGSRLPHNPLAIRALSLLGETFETAISCNGFGLRIDGRRRSAVRFILPPSSLILRPSLVPRGDAACSPGLSKSLITRRLSLRHFFFEAVYRIAGGVLAPYAASVPAPATAPRTAAASTSATALAPDR